MKYVAIREIPAPGDTSAVAYAEGDLVHETAVEGDDAWLVLGEDVAARPGVQLEKPAKSASHAAWAAYATSVGIEDAEGLSRAELIDATAKK
jgi:hypothetical protein